MDPATEIAGKLYDIRYSYDDSQRRKRYFDMYMASIGPTGMSESTGATGANVGTTGSADGPTGVSMSETMDTTGANVGNTGSTNGPVGANVGTTGATGVNDVQSNTATTNSKSTTGLTDVSLGSIETAPMRGGDDTPKQKTTTSSASPSIPVHNNASTTSSRATDIHNNASTTSSRATDIHNTSTQIPKQPTSSVNTNTSSNDFMSARNNESIASSRITNIHNTYVSGPSNSSSIATSNIKVFPTANGEVNTVVDWQSARSETTRLSNLETARSEETNVGSFVTAKGESSAVTAVGVTGPVGPTGPAGCAVCGAATSIESGIPPGSTGPAGDAYLKEEEIRLMIDLGIKGPILQSMAPYMAVFFDSLPKCSSDASMMLRRDCEVAYFVLWSTLFRLNQFTKDAMDANRKEIPYYADILVADTDQVIGNIGKAHDKLQGDVLEGDDDFDIDAFIRDVRNLHPDSVSPYGPMTEEQQKIMRFFVRVPKRS